jgi:5'-nucleotidase
MDFARAACLIRDLVGGMMQQGLRRGMLLNVNVPNFSRGIPKGVKVARMAVQPMADRYTCTAGPQGIKQYWLQGEWGDVDHQHETDLRVLLDGYVAVTPLQFDMTHRDMFGEVAGWNWPEL